MADEPKGSSITLHAHGDGTFHTIAHNDSYGGPMIEGRDPRRKEHPSIGHALMHIARMHSTGDQMHILGHDDGYTTHSVKEGGKIKGPSEHTSMRDLKSHVAETMDGDDED